MDEILLGSENRHFVNHSKTFLVSHSFSDEEHKQEVNNSIHKGSHFSNGIKFFFVHSRKIIPHDDHDYSNKYYKRTSDKKIKWKVKKSFSLSKANE